MLPPEKAVELCYQIPGQMWPLELRWLYSLGQSSRSHVEIGTYCGRSLMATVLGMSHGSVAVAVDNDQPMSDTGLEWIESVRSATFREIYKVSQVAPEFMKMSSLDAVKACYLAGRKFESIFIDASHHYAETKAEIESWRTLLTPKGVISGHDYWPVHIGVMDAVNEVFGGEFSVVPGTRIWFAGCK